MNWFFPTKTDKLRRIAKRVHKEKSPKVRKHLLKRIAVK